ncbi:MAG: hypothetical protein IJY70_04980, partial [Clostridia bacterium]|nr:hypothetical protein [Clostridia bacterium]
MDKFGIFKLLNSFFNFCEQSKGSSTPQENKGGGGFADLLSAFTSPQNQPPPQTAPSQNTTDKKPTEKVSPP